MSIQQLPLTLKWPEQSSFENFMAGKNIQLLKHLSTTVNCEGEFCTYLYSLTDGLGLTHLLQASCHAISQTGKSAAYLSFKHTNFSPHILEGMESVSLLCLDDIEQIAGQADWELAVFDLYHRLQEQDAHLLVAGHGLPKQIEWTLADLQSRLAAAVIFQLQSLADEEKIAVLKQRAAVRGLDLSTEVGQYLLSHYPRNMPALIKTLEKLDNAALVAQRRLTLPFIKTVLNKN